MCPGQTGPSPEEIEQDGFLEKLQEAHSCEDRSCPYDYCYVDPVSFKHLHLTHMLFRIWSAALVSIQCYGHRLILNSYVCQQGGIEGVTETIPPNSSKFDVSHRDPEEVSQLSRRRNNQSSVQNSGSHVTHVHLGGLSEVLGLASRAPNTPNASNAAVSTAARRPPNTTTFLEFSYQFQFSNDLHEKLKEGGITGPHLLRLISDDALKEMKLSFGQIALVRDSYERWLDLVVGDDGA